MNAPAPHDSWTTIDVAGHRCWVFEPQQPVVGAVLYLHAAGCETPADHPPLTSLFAQEGLRVIAPQTGTSWWCDRIAPGFDLRLSAERYLLEEVLPAIEGRWGVAPPLVGLLGISMGGQGGLRLAYKYPRKFPVVAAISPAVDFYQWLARPQPHQPEITQQLLPLYRDAEDARQDSATLHLRGLDWPRHQLICCDPTDHWHPGTERLREKLVAMGAQFECDLTTQAGGHSWEYFYAMAPRCVRFVAERLRQQSAAAP